jgi:hypothetical protein
MDRVLSLRTQNKPGADLLDEMLDLLIEEDGSVGIVYAHHTEEDMNLAMRQPWCSIGSDGSALSIEGPLRRGNPHPRNFGTFPRVLGEYVRERGLLRLEEAVQKMTSMNAGKAGLRDRGLLRVGQFADITVFDPAKIIDRSTYTEPFQYSDGIQYVVVNGELVVDQGKHTEARPGRALRKSDSPSPKVSSTEPASAQPAEFAPAAFAGKVAIAELNENSGLAASRINPGVLWAHNDSGDGPRVFALGPGAKHLATFTLQGVSPLDWEDIAVGPDPISKKNYIFLGDIGDNALRRRTIEIDRVEEPALNEFPGSNGPPNIDLSGVATIRLRYPHGERHNAETLLQDPLTGDLYVVTKHETARSRIYRAAYPQSIDKPTELEDKGEMEIVRPLGGSVSPTGSEVLLKTREKVTLYRRSPGTTLWEALQSPGQSVTYQQETQGEAVAFDSEGKDYFTLGEGDFEPLFRYRRVTK